MTRQPRIVIPDYPHHVTQRGNHRQTVFFSDGDLIFYLDNMKKRFASHELILLAYCLIPNHVHHVIIPPSKESLSWGVGLLHQDFARVQNLRCDRTGHLWQCRFYSCPVYDVWEVMAYAELNAMRAGLAKNLYGWRWSSAQAHLTGEDPLGVLCMDYWRRAFDPTSWEDFLKASLTKKKLHDGIRAATSAGYFWGPDDVAEQLERELGIRLRRRPRGRPRKRDHSGKLRKKD